MNAKGIRGRCGVIWGMAAGALLVLHSMATVSCGQEPRPGEKPVPEGRGSEKAGDKEGSKSVYDFTVRDIDGKEVSLSKYAGDVLLIVNVASECGYTEVHYRELEPMYRKYKDQGLRVLAFPSNDFGRQEPGTPEQIKSFCKSKYDVSFDLFDKVTVKGEKKTPLYKYLTEHPDPAVAGDVKWNFQKYLVGRDGKVLNKFDTKTPPNDPKVVTAVEEALKAPKPKKQGSGE